MPIPASDEISSDLGHGVLGIRYGLRPFRDLLSETVGRRHLWVELRPKKLVTGWEASGGGVYQADCTETFDGVSLDVVGVQTLTETLTRVESFSICSAISGTYFYQNDMLLCVHLMGETDPSTTSVVAQFGVHVGSHGVYQPILGSNKFVNGSLEAWSYSGGHTPDGWIVDTAIEGTSCVLDYTTSDPLLGGYASRITFTSAKGYKGLRQDFTTFAAGEIYRFSGAYRINSSTPSGELVVRAFVYGTGGIFVLSDGSSLSASSTPIFVDAFRDGNWCRFSFDFVCPNLATVRFALRAESLGDATFVTGTVDFDDLKLQHVPRYTYYEPLLSVDGIPSVEVARADSFWGEMSSSLGSFSVLNSAGRLSSLLAAYDWLGAEAIIRVGGKFQLGGNETPLEDCPIVASGRLGTPFLTDDKVVFDLEDDRKLLLRTLPIRTYNNNSGVDAYTQKDRGRSRALLFGSKKGIRPVQYDIHYTGGGPVPLGRYEVADCTDGYGFLWMDYVSWYRDESEASNRSLNSVAVGSTGASSITESLATGRFDVLHDMHPIILTDENNKLHFDIGGAVLTAALVMAVPAYPLYSMPTYDPASLCAEIAYKMNAVAGTADIACTFIDSTQKVRISKGAGTLNLRCATGADVQMGIWSILGFNVTVDKTGSLTYNADSVFTSGADSQILRIEARGYKDNGTGKYTGATGNFIVQIAPDIVHFILCEILKVPDSAIDSYSFAGARTADSPCSLYIGAPRTVSDVFSELETTGNMDLILDQGIWRCLIRNNSTVGVLGLVDSDFLSFESSYNSEDLFGTVTLTYNESPDGGDPVNASTTYIGYKANSRTEMGELTDPKIGLRFGRSNQKTFRTCLRDKVDATTNPARLQEIAVQAQTPRRRFRFSVKGKALLTPVNGKLLLTRAQGISTTGSLSNVLVRVISKQDDWTKWVSNIEAIEVI